MLPAFGVEVEISFLVQIKKMSNPHVNDATKVVKSLHCGHQLVAGAYP